MAATPPTRSSDPEQNPRKTRRSTPDRLRLGGLSPAKEKRSPKSLVAAIALHLVVGIVLIRVATLGHGLYDWLGLSHSADESEERITYVEPRVQPKPEPVQHPRPAPRVTNPASSPQGAAAPIQPVEPPTGGQGGADTASGASASGSHQLGGVPVDPNLRGIVPGNGDARVWQPPHGIVHAGRDRAENIDSIIGTVFGAARDSLDSLMRVNATARGGDWTKTDKNGNKWGWDNAGIRLGKVVIPNALLGLLPLNAQASLSGNPTSMANERRLAYARQEILQMSERSTGEADFKKSLKEIRERKEREHRVKPKPDETTNKPPPPKADN